MQKLNQELDFNKIRAAIVRAIQQTCNLDSNHVIEEEPETENAPRPNVAQGPYISLKITVPGFRYGDDSKVTVLDSGGNPTNRVRSSGPRKMTAVFNAYAKSHEDAYNLMMTWQSALDEELTQEYLDSNGISVLIIGTVADLSQLLNTAYEGRAHLDCQFGITAGVTSDLGEIDTVNVQGAINTGNGIVNTDDTF